MRAGLYSYLRACSIAIGGTALETDVVAHVAPYLTSGAALQNYLEQGPPIHLGLLAGTLQFQGWPEHSGIPAMVARVLTGKDGSAAPYVRANSRSVFFTQRALGGCSSRTITPSLSSALPGTHCRTQWPCYRAWQHRSLQRCGASRRLRADCARRFVKKLDVYDMSPSPQTQFGRMSKRAVWSGNLNGFCGADCTSWHSLREHLEHCLRALSSETVYDTFGY